MNRTEPMLTMLLLIASHLLEIGNINEETLESCSLECTSMQILTSYELVAQKRNNTLQPIVQAKKLSTDMAWRAALSGLEFKHLKAAHMREGIRALFTEKNKDGKPRVTDLKRIIDSVNYYFNLDQ